MFRAGHDDAFRVIHDRYRQRLFAYTRQMLAHRQDAEDALQDIFVRAYSGLRASDRELALRAWLYRVAHNRCIDELRQPSPPPPEVMQLLRSPAHDPITEADQRESLRRLIADVRRLPDQQRSALLMRELGGMSYADLAGALGVTVPAVKSLLVRARLALAQALEARDTACSEIREELIVSHDRGLRPNAMARRHMRDCPGCREFRHQLRGVSRRFGAIVPTLGPLGVLANLLGVGGGGGAAGGALAAGGAAGTGSAIVGVGTIGAGATHVATLLAAAVVTAGGAVELQHTLPASPQRQHHARAAAPAPARQAPAQAYRIAIDQTDLPSPPSRGVLPPVTPPAAPASGTTVPSGSSTSSLSTTLTTVTVPAAKPQANPTGGISTVSSVGGVSPSGPAGGTSTPTKPSSATAPASSTPSSGTGTGTAGQSGQPAGNATASGQPSSPSSSSTQPTSSGTPATGTSSAPSGAGSSSGSTPGGSPPPAP